MLVVEELSRVDPSVGVLVDVQNTLVINAILRWGSAGAEGAAAAGAGRRTRSAPTRCRRPARAATRSRCRRARARTATTSSSTAASSGSPTRNEADIFIVFATVNPEAGYRGITAFLVERGTAGFTVGKKEDKLGIRASSTCELLLEDCRVPKSHVLGEVGKGYKVAIETLNEGRIGIGAQMLGLAAGALEHAVDYTQGAQAVRQGDRRLPGRAVPARARGDRRRSGAAARLQRRAPARRRQPFLTEAAMCKLFASEVAERAASLAVNLFGGYGFVKDYPVEKLYRDAKIGQIYEGTSNLQLQTIAKNL